MRTMHTSILDKYNAWKELYVQIQSIDKTVDE